MRAAIAATVVLGAAVLALGVALEDALHLFEDPELDPAFTYDGDRL